MTVCEIIISKIGMKTLSKFMLKSGDMRGGSEFIILFSFVNYEQVCIPCALRLTLRSAASPRLSLCSSARVRTDRIIGSTIS